MLKKVLTSFHFPMIVKSVQEDMVHFQQEVADAKQFARLWCGAEGCREEGDG